MRLDGDRWHIRYLGEDVGVLPELPDFPDFTRLLRDWVGRVARRHPPRLDLGAGRDPTQGEISRDLAAFLAPQLLGALRQMDRHWRGGDCHRRFSRRPRAPGAPWSCSRWTIWRRRTWCRRRRWR